MRWSRQLCLLMAFLLLAPAIASLAAPGLASAQGEPYRHRRVEGWLLVETDVVALALNERRPFFAWWYVRENETIYVAHYKSLIEYYAWPNTSLLSPHAWMAALARRLVEEARLTPEELDIMPLLAELTDKIMALHVPVSADELEEIEDLLEELEEAISDLKEAASAAGEEELVHELEGLEAELAEIGALVDQLEENPRDHKALMELKREAGRLRHAWYHCCGRLRKAERRHLKERFKALKDLMKEAAKAKLFHPPVFAFAEGKWELDGPHDILAPNGTVIGIWFTYKLVEVHNPAFKFAEGNIMIRCRLYFEPVRESVDNLLNYTVRRGELKQDFVVLSWRWNVDLLKEVYEALGFENVTVSPEQTGLALRLELLTVNASGARLPGFLGELEEPSEARDVLGSLRHELVSLKELVVEACDKLADLAEEAGEELEEGAAPEDVSGLLQDMAFLVESTLASLDLHEGVLSKLEEEASAIGLGNLSALARAALGLLDEAKGFFRAANETIAELMEITSTLELITGLAALKEAADAFAEAFEEEVESLAKALADEAHELAEEVREKHEHIMVKARLGREEVDVRPDECTGREIRARTRVGLGREFEVRFMNETGTLAGWFKFVNASIVRYPDGRVEVRPVELAYLRAGRTLHLFLIYDYFDGGALEHDPSTGLDVPETAAEEPINEVEAPSGSETSPSVQQPTPGPGPGPGPGPVAYLLTPEGLVAVAVVLVVITLVAVWARRRGRTVNIY